MPDAEPDAAPVSRKPDWMPDATLRAMEQAAHRAFAWGRTTEGAAAAVCEVALAHMPAAPMRMIAEAVAAVLPDPEGLAMAGAPSWCGEPLTEASPEEVASSLSYATRVDERDKARRTGYEFAVGMAARQLAAHLAMELRRHAPAAHEAAHGGQLRVNDPNLRPLCSGCTSNA